MNGFRNTPCPSADDGGTGDGIDRKALWVVRGTGLPAVVRQCPSCWSTRHRPTGKFRVNAGGKLLDVWMLIGCAGCDRTSKIPVHERVHVRTLDHERLLAFERNDPAMVRRLAMDTALAGRCGYALDWNGTWEVESDVPFHDVERDGTTSFEVVVRFELPVPVRVERLVAAGFGVSRPAVRRLVDAGRIRLPVPVGTKVRDDFGLFVVPSPARGDRRD